MKIEIFTEYNVLLDKEEAKKGNATTRKDYEILFNEISKPLEKLNKENPDIELTYFFDEKTNEFSIFRSNPMEDEQKKVSSEFLVFLNQKAVEYLK